MGIEGGDSTECILAPKHFGKLSGLWHERPVDLCLISGKKIRVNVSQPMFQEICFWVVISNSGKTVNVAIDQTKNSFGF
jgi:hypothetical protein